MLFILVMDVFNTLIQRASDEGLLHPLSNRPLRHRVSLYADDVVLFIRPVISDLELIQDIMHLFGAASGLKMNIQKSSVVPIQCLKEDLAVVQRILPCELIEFSCKYLGLPLSIRKLTKDQIQPIIAKIVDQLPGWKAELMT